MKECPKCHRTYSDDTTTFCLADGSLLSAPYSPEAKSRPLLNSADPPPTEIIPSPLNTEASLSTQPISQSVPQSTILAAPIFSNQHSGSAPLFKESKSSRLAWLLGGLAFLIIVGFSLAMLSILRSSTSTTLNREESATNQTQTATLTPKPVERQEQAVTEPKPTGHAQPPTSQPSVSPSPSLSRATKEQDYSKIFSSNEVTSKAMLISKPQPQYTEEARQNQITGTVVLKVVFASSGQVTNIRAVSGLPHGLTERAIAAARQINFVPATKDGHQVSMWMQLEYNFNLY